MKMTPKQALRRWKTACERWVRLLGISDYTQKYKIYDELRVANVASGGVEAAEVSISTRYKWASFEAHKKYIEEASDDDLDETACHEVMHVLIDPLDDVVDDLISTLPKGRREGYRCLRSAQKERVVTDLTQVMRRLHQSPMRR